MLSGSKYRYITSFPRKIDAVDRFDKSPTSFLSHVNDSMQFDFISVFYFVGLQVYLHTAPLCHIGGISSCMAILMAGGCHVLMPKFDVKSAFDAIQEQGVTSFITVPAIMADLLSYARYEIALQFLKS